MSTICKTCLDKYNRLTGSTIEYKFIKYEPKRVNSCEWCGKFSNSETCVLFNVIDVLDSLLNRIQLLEQKIN